MTVRPPILDAALEYANGSFLVLPIKLNKAGKKAPPLKEWQRVATADPDVIRKWWGTDFKGCEVAVLIGTASNRPANGRSE